MAVFNFPANPTIGQNYLGPNGVTYTWDGEKWVGAATFIDPSDVMDLTPDPGISQTVTAALPTDTPISVVGAPNQSANLFEARDANSAPLTVIDEEGNIGIGVPSPTKALEVAGDISLTGGLYANGTVGLPGQHLVTDGIKAYWADDLVPGLQEVLAANNVSTLGATFGGDVIVEGDFTVRGTSTIVETEVIRLADNIITLNSNYVGNTPNENAGLEVNRGTLASKYWFWDETADRWSAGADSIQAAMFYGDVTGNVVGQVSDLSNHDTDDVAEGLNNLYFTDQRARQALTVTGDLQWNPVTGVLHYNESVTSVNGYTGVVQLTSDDVPEGATNLYYTTARANTDFDNRFATKTTDDLAEGLTNQYYSNTKVLNYIANSVSINNLSDVNTTAKANGDILYWDAAAGQWLTVAGDFEDNFVTMGAFDTTTGVVTLTRNDTNTITYSLDGRYLELTGGVLSGPLYGTHIQANTMQANAATIVGGLTANTVTAANVTVTDTLGVNNITANNGTFAQNVTANTSTFANTNVTDTLTANVAQMNNAVVNGGLVANTIGAANVDVADTLTANVALLGDVVVDKNITANTALFANANVTDTLTAQQAIVNGGLTANTIDAANVDVTDTLTANVAQIANAQITDGVVSGNLEVQGWLIANNVSITLDDLADANTAGVANGDVLYWDQTAGEWRVIAGNASDTYTTSSTFFPANSGIIEYTRNDGNTYSVDIDGRYLELVGGGTVTGAVTIANTLTADNAVVNGNLGANTATFANANVTDTLTANVAQMNNATVNGNLGANTATFANANVTDTLTANVAQINNATVNGNLGANTIGAANVDVTDTLTANVAQIVDAQITDGVVSGNLEVQGWLIANNVAIELDGLANANTTGKANGDVLYWDVGASEWRIRAAATLDTFTNAATFFPANSGILEYTRNDGNTYTVDIDGRYLELVGGGTVSGPVIFSNTVNANTIVANSATFAKDVAANNANITNNLTANNGTFAANLQANTSTFANTTVTDTLNANIANIANAQITEGTVSGNLEVQGWLIANNTSLQLGDLADANVASASNGEVLYYNSVAGEWRTKPDLAVANAAFQSTTGNVTINMTDTTSHVFNLDGRYPTTVNGVVPNSNGNIAISLTATQTGTLGARPATANDGLLYVVSGDANSALNGDTYIWVGNNTVGTWEEIAPSDVAGNDARYVNVSGDTMQGQFTLDAGQTFTANDDAASVGYVKDYVANVSLSDFSDANTTGAANGDILYWDQAEGAWKAIAGDAFNTYVNAATFATANGDLTHTRNDGNTVTVNLDGRYVVQPDTTSAANGDILVWNTATSSFNIVAQPSAQFDWQAAALAAAPTKATQSDGTTLLVDGDQLYDTNNNILYIYDGGASAWEPVGLPQFDNFIASANANTGWDGTGQTPYHEIEFVYANTAVANVYVDILHSITTHSDVDTVSTAPTAGDVLTWNGVSNKWEPVAPSAAQFDWQSGAGVPTTTTKADNTTAIAEGDMFWDTTNDQLYAYDAAIGLWVTVGAASFDNYIASATVASNNTAFGVDLVYANTAVANIAVDLAHSITNHTDVDTLTNTPTAGDVLTWNGVGNKWEPVAPAAAQFDWQSGAGVPTTTTKSDNTTSLTEGDMFWDTTNDQLYAYDAAIGLWVTVGATSFDNYIASANANTGWDGTGQTPYHEIEFVYANTAVANVYVDILHSITTHSDVDTVSTPPVANSSLLGWDGSKWVPVVSLDASSGAANDF